MLAELLLVSAMLQEPVRNPRTVEFDCVDHAQDTGHELDIVRVTDGAVIQTLQLGDPAPSPDGKVRAPVNVQPIAFGEYTVRVRAVAGSVSSENSADSNVFLRAPGQPGGVVVR